MFKEIKKISWPPLKKAVRLSLIAISLAILVGASCYGIDASVIALTKLFF